MPMSRPKHRGVVALCLLLPAVRAVPVGALNPHGIEVRPSFTPAPRTPAIDLERLRGTGAAGLVAGSNALAPPRSRPRPERTLR